MQCAGCGHDVGDVEARVIETGAPVEVTGVLRCWKCSGLVDVESTVEQDEQGNRPPMCITFTNNQRVNHEQTQEEQTNR